jgi:hypothetical protein
MSKVEEGAQPLLAQQEIPVAQPVHVQAQAASHAPQVPANVPTRYCTPQSLFLFTTCQFRLEIL